MSPFLIVLWAALVPVLSAGRQREELKHIQKEIVETRRQIEEYRRLDAELGLGLRDIEKKRTSSDRRMEDLQAKRRRLERQRREVEHQLNAVRSASGQHGEALSWELAEYYRKRASREEAYSSRDLWSESLRRGVILGHARLLGNLKGLSRKAELERDLTRRSSVELDGLSRRVRAEQDSARVEHQRRQDAFAKNRLMTAEAEKREVELKESARALTSLLRNLEKSRAQGRAPSPFGRSRHSLPWPVSGRVLETFGRSRHSELGTWTIRSGIRLATAAGAAVAAVDDGKVIFAGSFRSYGRVVILDHGAGFYSVYGDLSEILAVMGASVAPGGVVGHAGAKPEGGVVYLELRHGAEALDPLQWLRLKP